MKALCVFLVACSVRNVAEPRFGKQQQAETGTLRVLHTTDLHANVLAWDYFTGKADPKRGLAKIATLVKANRTPCTLLLDAGDATAGTPLATEDEPMANAMNALGYDAMALGNHEFDFAPQGLAGFVSRANFPVLAANVSGYTPYILKDVCGTRVGILGLTTPVVPSWAKPEQVSGLTFADPIFTAQTLVPKMKAEGAQVVVVLMHAGPDKQPIGNDWTQPYDDASKWSDRGGLPNENEAVQVAQTVPGVDMIISGHTHQAIAEMIVNGVVISQAGKWGSHLGVIESGHARLIPVDATVAQDLDVAATVAEAHAATLERIEQTIGTSTGIFVGGSKARVKDSALGDLINTVQMESAAAHGFAVDLSAAAIFSDAGLPLGDIRLRDAYGVYPYDNTLYVVEITGAQLRAALERDAEYFAQLTVLPPTLAECIVGSDFNYDLYSGIDYTLDATRPKGERVVALTHRGMPVSDAQTFRIALNNYRASGGGGYDMFKHGTVLWRSADGVREFLVRYIATHPLSPAADANYTLYPDLTAY